MSKLNIQISGEIELQKILKTIPENIPKVIFALSNFMENEVRKNLQKQVYSRSVWWKRTGKLQQSVQVQRNSPLSHRVVVGMKYGIFIEEGTRPHIIRAKSGGMLRFPTPGGYAYARVIHHPGTKARPFFAPARESTIAKARQLLNTTIIP